MALAGGRRYHEQGPFGGVGPNPTDRGKAGVKRSLLVAGAGGPLSIVVAGANVHDAKLLAADPGGDCGRTTTAEQGEPPTAVLG